MSKNYIKKLKNIFLLLVAFFMLALPKEDVLAEETSPSFKVRINIQINKKGDKGTISGREVLVYKLADDALDNISKVDLAKEYDNLDELSLKQRLGDPLFKKSSMAHPDKKNASEEVIDFDLYQEGVYLIKETDKSRKSIEKMDLAEPLVTTIIKLPDDMPADSDLLEIKIKTETESNPPNDEIKLIKKDYYNKNKAIDKVGFRLYKREPNPLYESNKFLPPFIDKLVYVTGDSGRYVFSSADDNIKEEDVPLLKTNTDGEIIVSYLPKGDYYFKEVKPARGYENASNVGMVSDLLTNGQTTSLYNKKIPFLEKKDSETGESLSDVGFEVYNKQGNRLSFSKEELGTYTYDEKSSSTIVYTNAKGAIILNNMKEDEGYYFKEVRAKDGYKKTDEKFYFDVDKNGNILINKKNKPLVILNSPIRPKGGDRTGDYNFIKVSDDEEKTRLKGAKFVVSKKTEDGFIDVIKDSKIYVVSSDEKGEFSVKDLEYGKYYLREIAAPAGYILENEPIEFEISAKTSLDNPTLIVNKKNPDNPPGNPPDTPGNPPDTPENPPETTTPPKGGTPPKGPRGPIVKTGDIKILISLAVGIVMVVLGSRMIVLADKKNI